MIIDVDCWPDMNSVEQAWRPLPRCFFLHIDGPRAPIMLDRSTQGHRGVQPT